jgi:predicted RNase H-like HicB family nuclease
MRYVLLYQDEENNWIAEVPSLPGCHSDGQTREEAIARVKEAIDLYIEVLRDDNVEVPEEFPNLSLFAVETHIEYPY